MSETGRLYIGFNDNWTFALGDYPDAYAVAFDDTQWRTLRLPHDWSIEGSFYKEAPTLGRGGYLPTGIGWYRKRFDCPDNWNNKSITLRFGGIYRCSTVWVNGVLVGERPNGYVELNYDISDYLHPGQENIIAVRVDNSQQPGARYYTGSGIYREVSIVLHEAVRLSTEHPFVTTEFVENDEAHLQIVYGIDNPKGIEGSYKVCFQLEDNQHNPVWNGEQCGILKNSTSEEKLALTLKNPHLWDTEDPYLYTLVTKLYVGSQLMDDSRVSCGIRQVQWRADAGFWLNGRQVPIKGVCLHQDNGCLGVVANKTAEARKLSLMKQMGCNAVRVAHNPVSDSFLTLCDEMGILVMDEMFDEWFTRKTMLALQEDNSNCTVLVEGYAHYFKQWYAQDLEEVILRDRVHPSIIAYSVGNELMEQRFGVEEAIPYLQDICRRIKAIDSTRAVTCACCFDVEGTEESHFYDDLDLVGYNYAEVLYEEHSARFPARKIIGSENTSITPLIKRGTYDLEMLSKLQRSIDLARGEYISSSESRHLCGEYSMRKHIQSKCVGGMFIWTGMDYLGEPTPYTWPSRSAYFGVVDTCGFPKDAFYFYQSCWQSEPMIHLLPHWNWEGMEGKYIDVLAYTNCPQAELFLNGVSQGICRFDPQKGLHLHWSVPYAPGELTVKGYSDIGEVCAVDTVVTAGKPAAIRLYMEKPILRNRDELCYVKAQVVDSTGNLVPMANSEVTFEPQNGIVIVGVDNGDPTYVGKLKSNTIPALSGLCLCVLQHGNDKGVFSLRASSPGLQPDEVTILCE